MPLLSCVRARLIPARKISVDRLDVLVIVSIPMRLGQVLRLWRKMSDAEIREIAAEIGISHGTLSRVERGEPMQGETLAKILAWLLAEGGKRR